MTANTPIYGWPYPTDTDTLKSAVKATPQALATAIENTLASLGGLSSPGAWTAPTLAGVANLGGGYAAAGYAKTANWVELAGTLQGPGAAAVTAPVTMFVLPVGFRPLANRVFACGGDGFKRVDVFSNGNVSLQTNLAAATGFVDLSNIRFRIDR